MVPLIASSLLAILAVPSTGSRPPVQSPERGEQRPVMVVSVRAPNAEESAEWPALLARFVSGAREGMVRHPGLPDDALGPWTHQALFDRGEHVLITELTDAAEPPALTRGTRMVGKHMVAVSSPRMDPDDFIYLASGLALRTALPGEFFRVEVVVPALLSQMPDEFRGHQDEMLKSLIGVSMSELHGVPLLDDAATDMEAWIELVQGLDTVVIRGRLVDGHLIATLRATPQEGSILAGFCARQASIVPSHSVPGRSPAAAGLLILPPDDVAHLERMNLSVDEMLPWSERERDLLRRYRADLGRDLGPRFAFALELEGGRAVVRQEAESRDPAGTLRRILSLGKLVMARDLALLEESVEPSLRSMPVSPRTLPAAVSEWLASEFELDEAEDGSVVTLRAAVDGWLPSRASARIETDASRIVAVITGGPSDPEYRPGELGADTAALLRLERDPWAAFAVRLAAVDRALLALGAAEELLLGMTSADHPFPQMALFLLETLTSKLPWSERASLGFAADAPRGVLESSLEEGAGRLHLQAA